MQNGKRVSYRKHILAALKQFNIEDITMYNDKVKSGRRLKITDFYPNGWYDTPFEQKRSLLNTRTGTAAQWKQAIEDELVKNGITAKAYWSKHFTRATRFADGDDCLRVDILR